jgi:serine/threonine-protein kinase
VLLPEHSQDEGMVHRFEREALAAGSLLHPNILPVFDFDFDDQHSVYFLAMQYVPGGQTLQSHVGSPMDPAELAPTLQALASALDSAHERGIIHRDVKPANVLLHGARPLLTDFGIARLGAMAGITAMGTAIGTPAYMSAEQATGNTVLPASDQYSLAVMAYELLAARLPFLGDPMKVLMQHVTSVPPNIVSINPRLPAGFADVFARALNKKAEDRFPSCTEFASALNDILTHAPQTPAREASGTLVLQTVEIPVEPAEGQPALVAMDLNGRITSINVEAEELLGVAAVDSVGQPYPAVLGSSLSDRLVALFFRVARSRDATTPQILAATLPNGRRVLLEATLHPIFGPTGEISGIVFVARPAADAQGADRTESLNTNTQ